MVKCKWPKLLSASPAELAIKFICSFKPLASLLPNPKVFAKSSLAAPKAFIPSLNPLNIATSKAANISFLNFVAPFTSVSPKTFASMSASPMTSFI